ncbi:MAG TPA: pyridoxine 5'-phosphate synthase [Epsilonproteobacteria bacterium]|nr:pyridoxine 5'-phosphate synthase [Campylobacterota bacterium]
MKLGVNIDHIAVLREARRINDPNPLDALSICEKVGVEQITIHLREDRRHIQDKDAQEIIIRSKLPVNLECAIESGMIEIACALKPHRVTLVPEKRQEVTTEGGLALSLEDTRLTDGIKNLHAHGIEVSLFVDPTDEALSVSKELGVEWIEFHTGAYANIFATLHTNIKETHHAIKSLDLPKSTLQDMLDSELAKLKSLSAKAHILGLHVAAGHGLNYDNVKAIAQIDDIEELNIGQSIIARSIWVGLKRAILQMQEAIK